MNEREYDLLTTAPAMSREQTGEQKGCVPSTQPFGRSKTLYLRSINRAPALVRKLFVGEFQPES